MLQDTLNLSDGIKRPSGRLGRKFALVLLPLVLIPLIIMGVIAYFRVQSILRQEAIDQMIYAIQGQSTTLLEWASVREQQLFLGTQRPVIKEAALTLYFNPDDEEANSIVQEELQSLIQNQGDTLFTEILLIRISNGLVVSSTNPEHRGRIFENLPPIRSSEIQTYPIYDDPIFNPDSLGLYSLSPLRVAGSQPDFYLLGVNSGSKVVQLIEDLQVFWQRRGVYRIERGKTALALSPDLIFELPRYATSLSKLENIDHPIFQTSISDEAGTLQYEGSDNQPVLSAYQWIPDWNLALVVELPTSEIFTALADLAPFMAILIFLAAVITLSVAFVVTNRMLQPLTSLAEFANQISLGEWHYRVPEDRDDELGELATSLNRMAQELGALYQSLESRVEDRTRQIRTASDVARAIISIPNLDELLRQAVRLIKDRFGYDHVSIFLVDANGAYAELRETAGEINGTTRTVGHKVPASSQTLIGWVIENNEARVITDESDEADAFKSELLRGARTQVAIPLQVAGRSLGVIDIQNVTQHIFDDAEFDVLQTLADQLSSAIENARLAQESADAADRAKLVSEITTQLSGILEPEQILQTTAQALHRALDNAEIVIKLVPSEPIPPPIEEGEN